MAVRKRRKPSSADSNEMPPVTPQENAQNKRFVMTLVVISLLFILGFVLLQYGM